MKTRFITFPRSGSQLVIAMLYAYCDNNFKKHLTTVDGIHGQGVKPYDVGKMKFCQKELHKCDKNIFCNDDDVNIQHTHGFPHPNLENKFIQNINYIIQYRHPIECALSWCGYSSINHSIENFDFINHMNSTIKMWIKFVDFYLLEETPKNVFKLEYNDFMNNPKKNIYKIFKIAFNKINYRKINKILNYCPIEYKSNIKKFLQINEYIDFLYECELLIKEKLNKLKIPLINWNELK